MKQDNLNSMKFKIPNTAIKYILFQRTANCVYANMFIFRAIRKLIPYITYKGMVGLEARIRRKSIKEMYLNEMEQEYQSIKRFLPSDCKKNLDIGCGVAGINLFLNEHYSINPIDFYLLDKTHIENKIYYMFEENGAYYNSLNVSKDLLVNNGIEASRVHLLEATDTYDIDMTSEIDLALSLISWGFHYPIETYLDKVYSLLREGGHLILDIRKKTDGLGRLKQKFGKYKIISDTEKYVRVRAAKS